MSERRSLPSDAMVDLRAITEITIISHLAQSLIERVLPDGMTQSQFGLLNHFARRGGEETPAQLAAAFQVTKGAVTNTLQRLEILGLIAIRPDPGDGRQKLVSITAAGLEAQEAAFQALGPKLEAIRAEIPQADFAAALPFLSRLRAWLDENR